MRKPFPRLLITLAAMVPFGSALGLGEPHVAITKAALEVLPSWEKDLLGDERARLGHNYCLIPDHVYTDKANAKYATMDTLLHLPLRNNQSPTSAIDAGAAARSSIGQSLCTGVATSSVISHASFASPSES